MSLTLASASQFLTVLCGSFLGQDSRYVVYFRIRILNIIMLIIHLMQFHELSDAVEHIVVLGGGAGHLLDDRGHMPKYRRVEQG